MERRGDCGDGSAAAGDVGCASRESVPSVPLEMTPLEAHSQEPLRQFFPAGEGDSGPTASRKCVEDSDFGGKWDSSEGPLAPGMEAVAEAALLALSMEVEQEHEQEHEQEQEQEVCPPGGVCPAAVVPETADALRMGQASVMALGMEQMTRAACPAMVPEASEAVNEMVIDQVRHPIPLAEKEMLGALLTLQAGDTTLPVAKDCLLLLSRKRITAELLLQVTSIAKFSMKTQESGC